MKKLNQLKTSLKNESKVLLIILVILFFILITLTGAFGQIRVAGTITDKNNGAPLPGANVYIKGTTTGTVSDVEGKYTIEVPQAGSLLVFSFIGYETIEEKIEASGTLNVSLIPKSIGLNETVVIGYGIQKKSDVTGSITSVSSEDINKTASANLSQSLQGKAAGVHISSSSGAPGAEMNVRIRGIGSVNGTEPLFIIDGFEGRMENVNVNDIESIEILKDASATAIYGSRGANGVVVITTKRGKPGDIRLDFSMYSGVQQVGKKLDLLDADEYSSFMHTAYANSNLSVPAAYSDTARIANGNVNTDWQNEALRVAPVQNYYLSASGGGEKSNYAFSLGYFNQEGIFTETGYEKFTARSSADFNIQNWLKAGETFSATYIYNNIGYQDAGTAFQNLTLASPLMPVYDENNLGGFAGPSVDLTGNNTITNMIGIQKLIDNDRKIINPRLDAYIEITFLKDFTIKSSGSIGANITRDTRWVPKYDMGIKSQGSAELIDGRNITYNWKWENTLNFTKSINKHNVNVLVGQTREYWSSTNLVATGREYVYPELRLIGNATNTSAMEYFSEWALSSYLGRVIYDYQSKYLLTASIRRDGSSIFGPNKRFGNFPSASVGWKFLDEGFIREIVPDVVQTGKIRIGWGQSGSQNFRPYLWEGEIRLHPYANYTFNGVDFIPGAYPVNAGNKNLGWETIEQTNFGLDLTFFGNKLAFTTDYYNKKTRDMLLILPQPSIIGNITDPPSNLGEVSNSGFEFDLTYRKMEGKFNYTLKANLTTIQNEVNYIGTEGIQGRDFRNQNELAPTMTQEGYPVAYFFGWKTDGIFQSQEEIEALIVRDDQGNIVRHYQSPLTQPGDIKFVDVDGNGYIDDDDRTYIGKSIPDFVYGLSFNGTYNNFDISVSLQGVQGVEIYNKQKQLLGLPGNNASLGITDGNKLKEVLNAWTADNPSTRVPRAGIIDNNLNGRNSDWWIENGSYLRVGNMQIGYDFANFLKSLNISRARIFLSADNLLVLTKYSGYDPDIGQKQVNRYDFVPLLNNGIDYGIYPKSKIFTAGLQLNF